MPMVACNSDVSPEVWNRPNLSLTRIHLSNHFALEVKSFTFSLKASANPPNVFLSLRFNIKFLQVLYKYKT